MTRWQLATLGARVEVAKILEPKMGFLAAVQAAKLQEVKVQRAATTRNKGVFDERQNSSSAFRRHREAKKAKTKKTAQSVYV